MEQISGKVSGLGAFLVIAGLLSTVLSLIDYNLKILIWIDMWGAGVGWGIRIGLIVVGAALFLIFKSKDDDEQEEDEEGQESSVKQP